MTGVGWEELQTAKGSRFKDCMLLWLAERCLAKG